MYHLNPDLIDQLSKGEIALENDKSSLLLLRQIIAEAFPEDKTDVHGASNYYYAGSVKGRWTSDAFGKVNSKVVKIYDFLLKEEENKFIVSREALKEIYDIVCPNWQSTIEWYLRSQLFEKDIELKPSTVIDAHNAATTQEQKAWLNKYLPKPKKKVKKEVAGFLNVYPKSVNFHKTEESAKRIADTKYAIAIAVPVKGEYEIEE